MTVDVSADNARSAGSRILCARRRRRRDGNLKRCCWCAHFEKLVEIFWTAIASLRRIWCFREYFGKDAKIRLKI